MDYQIYSLNLDDSKKENIGQMHSAPEDQSSYAFALAFCSWVSTYEKRHAMESGYEAEPIITKITTGFYSADLFHGWEESDINLYDEAVSAEKYADFCKAAIEEDYPEAEIEVLYQSGATGELPYTLQTRVNDIGVAGSGNEALDAERVDDIVGRVYAEYEWCVKKE